MIPDSLLLVLPVPLRRQGESLCFESQACNGLDRWADNFRRLVVACPVEPESLAPRSASRETFLPVEQIHARDRIEFLPLPWAYGATRFLATYRPTRALLAERIRQCEFLSFMLGGMVGDWAAVACLESLRQRRPFSVWTDRVEYEVIQSDYVNHTGPRRWWRRLVHGPIVAPLMKRYHRHIVSRCDLGLFHGRDCYHAYAPFCRNSHVVHDIHLKPEDQITAADLAAKVQRVRSGEPLRLVYVGRAAQMKGALDWVRVLARVRERGVPFRATWLGDGPLLAEMRCEVARRGLEDVVELRGHVSDRPQVLQVLRDADLFVFCHKTPESPRCLIEALLSGCVLAGYDSPYPRELVESLADRLLTPRHDEGKLADRIAQLHGRRDELGELIEACALAGSKFSDVEVFRHRSELIRRYLSAAPKIAAGGGAEQFGL